MLSQYKKIIGAKAAVEAANANSDFLEKQNSISARKQEALDQAVRFMTVMVHNVKFVDVDLGQVTVEVARQFENYLIPC